MARLRGSWSVTLRRTVAVVLGLVATVFLVSNLLLGIVAEKELRSRTRMNWTVGRATWTPWGGVSLSKLRAELEAQPGMKLPPVLTVEGLRVTPYWRSLFEKRPQFQEVVVEEPVGNIPIQLLSLLVASGGGGAIPQVKTPEIAADPDPAAPVVEKPEGKKPKGTPGKKPPKKPRKKSPKKPKTPKKPGKKTGKPVVEKKEVLELELPSWVRVRGGSLRVYSLGSPARGLNISGVELDLPIAGAAAGGVVKVAEVSMGKFGKLGPIEQTLQWRPPFLEWSGETIEWSGLKLELAGRLRARGRPEYAMVLQTKPGGLQAIKMPEWTGLEFEVEEVRRVLLRGEGDLRSPRTWRGDLLVDVRGVDFRQKGWDVSHHFDLGQVVGVFRQGVLQIADARLRSDSLSLMGNGIVASNGSVWSVLRVVADPEYARVINRAAIGSNITRGWMSSWLRPLLAPDRLYRDIHLEGTVARATVDVGRKREELEIRAALRMMRSFLTGEVLEEEQESFKKEEASS